MMRKLIVILICTLATATYAVDMGGATFNGEIRLSAHSDMGTNDASLATKKYVDDNAGGDNLGYMHFEIPLNPGGYPGNWTDFEFKIEEVDRTTTNAYNPVYFWQSMGDPWDEDDTNSWMYMYGDADARCYFTSSCQMEPPLNLDARKWQLYTNPTPGVVDTSAIADRLQTGSYVDDHIQTVQFYPSHDDCAVDWTTWQWYTNSHNLRASWVRYDAIGAETNSQGSRIWHPIEIQWVPKRKNEAL